MRNRVAGVVDRGVLKFAIHNKQGCLCGWLTLPALVLRDQFQKQSERPTPVAAVVSLRKDA
jgi:hypothetical protein